MNIFEFIDNYDVNNLVVFPTMENPSPQIPLEITLIFTDNRDTIINSYFDDINKKVKELRFDDLFANNVLFLLTPFQYSDLSLFIDLINNINLLISEKLTQVKASLLNFLWFLLDYIYHDNSLHNDEITFISALLKIKKSLYSFERFEDEVDLLHQKLGHWGID